MQYVACLKGMRADMPFMPWHADELRSELQNCIREVNILAIFQLTELLVIVDSASVFSSMCIQLLHPIMRRLRVSVGKGVVG